MRLRARTWWCLCMLAACSSEDDGAAARCQVGQQAECVCPGATAAGVQTCLADGTWTICACSSAPVAGTSGAPAAGSAGNAPPQVTGGSSAAGGAGSGSGGMAGVAGAGAGGSGGMTELDSGIAPDAGSAGADAGMAGDDGGMPPPFTPVYRIAVRAHAANSALTDAEFEDIFAEVNFIWLSQAGVCFEFELVDDEQLGERFDIWYEPGGASDPNGYYSGDHDIWSRDHPSLGAAPNPVEYPTARTTAHEFGHGLGLNHQDFGDACPGGSGDLDCDDLLMRSGRRGFFLSDVEIATAREVAERKALDDTLPLGCGSVVIGR